MSIVFNAEDHSYKSIELENSIQWTSVTTLISHFKKPFDPIAVSQKVSKNKKSKWYGIDPVQIQEIWKNEGLRATTLGTFYHNQRESDICSLASMEIDSFTIPVIQPIPEVNGLKYAPSQKLDPGVYPEHMVYLKSVGICGQSDLVEVVDGKINIIDYKTNKEIKSEAFKNWEGLTDKMLAPVNNLDDCNLNHYTLQLSIYMYIMIKHNPKLRPGKLFIHHVQFEVEREDEFGYPIIKFDNNGDPIVKEVTPIELPYLKDEVISIFHWLKDNKETLAQKKH